MKRVFLSIFVFIVLGFVSCFSFGCEETQAPSGPVFTMYISSEPANLDPAKGVDVHEAKVQSKIYEGLVKYNAKMQLEGCLAESWSVSDDGRVYTFNLKKGVKFHNGAPFTAKDVVFSFGRILAPSTASSRRWVLEKILGSENVGENYAVEGIKAKDDFTVELTLKEPFAPFICLLTMPACYIVPSSKKLAAADFEKPIGTGPFAVKERVRDSYVHLQAFEGYHGQKPGVNTMYIRIIPENMKAEMEFEGGNLDMLILSTSNYSKYKQNEVYKDRIKSVPALNIYYLGFNNRRAPFDDIRVRQALNMLIDRNSIIEQVYKGRATAAKGCIPPGIGGYDDALKGYSYDIDGAKKLLNEAGYCCGSDKPGENGLKPLEFEIYHRAQQDAFELCRFMQGELAKNGISVKLKSMEWSAMKDAVNKGEASAFFMNWFADYPDGENFIYPTFHSKNIGSGGNRAAFANKEIDSLLDACVKITDQAKREAAYREINKKIVEQAPWIFLWHTNESFLLGSRIDQMDISPVYFCDSGVSIKVKE